MLHCQDTHHILRDSERGVTRQSEGDEGELRHRVSPGGDDQLTEARQVDLSDHGGSRREQS